jgi:hypothetical protein
MQTLDQSRIEAFAGQIATEVGAALNAALVTVGDELGLYRAMPANSRRAPTRTSATCASGSTRRPQAAS